MRRFWAITARILLVAAILLAVRVYSGSSTPQPQFGTGSVIPWTPASPEPAPSPSPKPTPVPTGTPKCRPEDVRAVYWQSGAATGHLISSIAFVNTGQERCFVSGRPTLQLVTTEGRKLPESTGEGSFYPDEGPVPVMLEPGLDPPKEAEGLPRGEVSIGFELFDCKTNYQIDRILVTFDGGTHEVGVDPGAVGFSGQAACDGNPEADNAPPTTTVSNFVAAPEPEPEQEPSVYSSLRVSMDAPSTASPGERLRYLVTLANPSSRPFPFSPDACPTYFERVVGAGAETERYYALNCGGVVIAAGGSATFEMIIDVPSLPTDEKAALVWELDPYRYGPGSKVPIEVR